MFTHISLSRVLLSGNERTEKAKRNILGSVIIKGMSILIGLLLVPLTINFLDPIKYGVWTTLSSIISWLTFFDIGLGNGLRNRLVELIANKNYTLAKSFISTTYAIITIISVILLILLLFINPLINWARILNIHNGSGTEYQLIVFVLGVTFLCGFVFRLITAVLNAYQEPAKASIFDLFGKILALILILLLQKFATGSLLILSVIMSVSPLLILIFANLYYFNGKFKVIKPSISFIDFSKAPNLLNLGLKFFIIQIAAIILYQTNNIIITQIFGPEQVTSYNIVFRYFNIIIMAFSIILTPFWSGFTDAWSKEEIAWIVKVMTKLFKLWAYFIVLIIVMLLMSKYVYQIWIGNAISIPFSLSLSMSIWIILFGWNSIFSVFLNGIGKVKYQLYIGIISAVFNIPLSIMLSKSLGIEGILYANIFLSLIGATTFPVQYYKIINGKASGLWNK